MNTTGGIETVLAAAVKRHAQHDPRDCDCGPALILLVLHLREVAEWLTTIDWAALAAAVGGDTE